MLQWRTSENAAYYRMSVDKYNINAVHLQKKLNIVPHIDVPDATAQATIYSSGPHEHKKSKLESRLDVSKCHDVQYMSLMLKQCALGNQQLFQAAMCSLGHQKDRQVVQKMRAAAAAVEAWH